MAKKVPRKPRDESKSIELSRLIELANAGKPQAIKLLRRTMDRHPQIWRQAGDLARLAEQQLTMTIMQSNRFGRDSLKRKLAELRTELGGSSSSPIIRLAVERVVACWLQLQYYDILADASTNHASSQARAVAKRQDQANRRFIQALKTLGTLRRLAPATEADHPDTQVQVFRPKQSHNARTA